MVLEAEPVEAGRSRRVAILVRMHHEVGAAAKRALAHRVHVADDHVRCEAALDQRVRAAVDRHDDGTHLTEVAGLSQQGEVLAVVGAPHHDQDLPPRPVDAEVGHADLVVEQVGTVLDVLDRVAHEAVQLDADARPAQLVGRGDRLRRLAVPPCDQITVDVHLTTDDADGITLVDALHQVVAQPVDQGDARGDDQQRSLVRIAAGR
jgi:hypothetical protein